MSVGPTRGVDLLTRTTLKIAPLAGGASIAQLIQALQRVPGVLFAEAAPGNGAVVVSHDAGVPTATLLQAAIGVGVNGVLVGAGLLRAPHPAESATSRYAVRSRQLLIAAIALLATLGLAYVLVPTSAEKHWLLMTFTWLLWVLFVAQILRRRRT